MVVRLAIVVLENWAKGARVFAKVPTARRISKVGIDLQLLVLENNKPLRSVDAVLVLPALFNSPSVHLARCAAHWIPSIAQPVHARTECQVDEHHC